MKNAILNLPTGSITAQDEGKVVQNGSLVNQTSLSIIQNNTYDTTTKNQVIINVPNSYATEDEGKVVSNGTLVAQGSDTVTQNGTVNTTFISSLTVNVSGGGGAFNWNEPIIRNWDFSNPVNTRGKTSYSNEGSINGWICVSDTTCNISDGGIYVLGTGTSMYYQYEINLSDYNGKTFTLSLLANNKLSTVTFVFSNSNGREANVTVDNLQFWLNKDSDTLLACGFYNRGYGDNTLIQGIKLEVGTVQTLAEQVNGTWQLIKHQSIAEETIFIRAMAKNF